MSDEPVKPQEQPSRVGKRSVGGHFSPEVAKAIRILAAKNDKTVQIILAEALNDYFQKHGLERIADETPLARGAAARKPKIPAPNESEKAKQPNSN